jgi:hypothetical protein
MIVIRMFIDVYIYVDYRYELLCMCMYMFEEFIFKHHHQILVVVLPLVLVLALVVVVLGGDEVARRLCRVGVAVVVKFVILLLRRECRNFSRSNKST